MWACKIGSVFFLEVLHEEGMEREREREVGRLSKVSHNKRRYFASSFPFLSRIDVTLVGSVSLHFLPIHEIRGKKNLEVEEWQFGDRQCSHVNIGGR